MDEKMHDIIRIDSLCRITAFLLYKGKMYESEGNHQDCLLEILRDEGKVFKDEYGFDFDSDKNYDNGIDRASEITWAMMHEDGNDVIGFDLWDVWNSDGAPVLAVHFKEDAEPHREFIETFARERGYTLACYLDDYRIQCGMWASDAPGLDTKTAAAGLAVEDTTTDKTQAVKIQAPDKKPSLCAQLSAAERKANSLKEREPSKDIHLTAER